MNKKINLFCNALLILGNKIKHTYIHLICYILDLFMYMKTNSWSKMK